MQRALPRPVSVYLPKLYHVLALKLLQLASVACFNPISDSPKFQFHSVLRPMLWGL